MAKEKPNIIIVEAPQGGGKTTVTNILRDKLPYTNLLRLSGIDDMSVKGKKKVYKIRKAELNMIKKASGNINFVLDRCHITEQIYCNLGFKEYTFEDKYESLNEQLSKLTKKYNVYLVLLEADRMAYVKRLNRDKPKFLDVDFTSSNSFRQQAEYIFELNHIQSHYPKIHTMRVDTTDKSPKEVAEHILKHVGCAHLI